jgi:hypothetical protein
LTFILYLSVSVKKPVATGILNQTSQPSAKSTKPGVLLLARGESDGRLFGYSHGRLSQSPVAS